MLEIEALESVIKRIKRIENAKSKVYPISQIVRNGEALILEEIRKKAPELVEPLHAIFLLHFGMMHYVEGERQPPGEWTEQIAQVQRFVMEHEDGQHDVE